MDTLDLRNKKEEAQPEPKVLKSKESSSNEISWEAFFHNKPQKRSLNIFVSVLLIGALGIFIFGDPLTAIFLLLSSFVLIIYSNKKPEIRTVSVDRRGVLIGDVGFEYKDLKSFWIDYEPGEDKELSLELKKWYIPYIKVALEDQNPLELRAHLINFIPEKEHEKSLADIISKKLGL